MNRAPKKILKHTPVSIAGMIFAMLLASSCTALGQASNEVTDVTPDAAAQGYTGLTVTFTLDTDFPPAPPANVLPDSVQIGTMTGTSITHDSQYLVTATFDIPFSEVAGTKDVTITFETPDSSLVFSQANAFTVELGVDVPPSILQAPVSQRVEPGGNAMFTVIASGTEPLQYQWQKDEIDLPNSDSNALTILAATEVDAGQYRCVVTNDFGSATSEEATLTVSELPSNSSAVVHTGQTTCYNEATQITCPSEGSAFYGQNAQYIFSPPSYTLGDDGLTVYDNVTGLQWQRSPDVNRDGSINADDKLTYDQAMAYPATLNTEQFAGYNDWRLPTIKELYSLIDFNGIDPSSYSGSNTSGLVPFIDTNYFDFEWGDTESGERIIDSQWATSSLYVSTVDGELLFGVNFADGRIKGYWLSNPQGGEKTFYTVCVRGNTDYGINNFADNGDGTITDRATGLMWMQEDSGTAMLWQDALDYAENLTYAGYDDWRLPNIKELQSIVDYTRSPDTTGSAAIDPIFNCTQITNEEGVSDYPYFWSGTTHVAYPTSGASGSYVAFGRGLGYMNGQWMDVHGAGCQRSDPKTGDPSDYPYGHGPQGDAIRVYNYVRPVRGCSGTKGDLNCDQTVDLSDYAKFAAALAGPKAGRPTACTPDLFSKADLDADLDVDLMDFGGLQKLMWK